MQLFILIQIVKCWNVMELLIKFNRRNKDINEISQFKEINLKKDKQLNTDEDKFHSISSKSANRLLMNGDS